jgi:LysR family transcriptional regulator of gallate degradation
VRTRIVPKAITHLLAGHSYLDVSTVEGPYHDLITGLRCGDIDIVIGALRGEKVDKDLQEEVIFTDSLSLIVRAGHPLTRRNYIAWRDLVRYQWILPRPGTPTRDLFERTIQRRGLALPDHVVETSSTVMLRGLLLESDRITVLSRHQIQFEEEAGLLAVLPFDLSGSERPIGMTRRRTGALSPAAELFVDEVRTAANQCMSDTTYSHQLRVVWNRPAS